MSKIEGGRPIATDRAIAGLERQLAALQSAPFFAKGEAAEAAVCAVLECFRAIQNELKGLRDASTQ